MGREKTEKTDIEEPSPGVEIKGDEVEGREKTEKTDIEERREMNEKDWTMGPEWEKALR